MGEQDHKVAVISGGSHGIGAGLVAGYRPGLGPARPVWRLVDVTSR